MGSWSPRIMCEYDLTTTVVIQLLIQPCACEMGSSVFSAMSWLKFTSTTRSPLPSMPLTERKWRNFSLYYGSAYHAYRSWFSTNNPGELPLDQICRCPYQSFQFWCWWWLQSVGSISPKSLCHPVPPIFHSPDGYLSMICYVPGGWATEVKAHWERYSSLLHTLLWRTINKPHFLQLSVWPTLKDVTQPPQISGGWGGVTL